jgi:hypothetical protein
VSRPASLLTLVVLACASSSQLPAHEPGSRETTAYFIRSNQPPVLWNVQIYLDGEKVGSVANRSSVAITAPAGEHQLVFGWPLLAGGRGLQTEFRFKPGATQYFLIGGLEGVELPGQQALLVQEVPPERGQDLLRTYHD